MSHWDDSVAPPVPPPVMVSPVQDPLQILLAAIAASEDKIHETLNDLKDQDLHYIKTRIDAQWQTIQQMETRKADRSEMKDLETRMQAQLHAAIGRNSDDIVRVEQIAQSSEDTYDNLEKRLSDIETETKKIPDMAKSIDKLEEQTHDLPALSDAVNKLQRQVGRLNRISWQVAGAVTAATTFGLTIGYFWHIIIHLPWFSGLALPR